MDESRADHENLRGHAEAMARAEHAGQVADRVGLVVRAGLQVDRVDYVDANAVRRMDRPDEEPVDHGEVADHVAQVAVYENHPVDRVVVVHADRQMVVRAVVDRVAGVHAEADRSGDIVVVVVVPAVPVDVDTDYVAMVMELDSAKAVPLDWEPAEVASDCLPAKAKPFSVEGAAQSIDFLYQLDTKTHIHW